MPRDNLTYFRAITGSLKLGMVGTLESPSRGIARLLSATSEPGAAMRRPLYAMGLPEAPIGGEGITRTSNPEAKLFCVKVEFEKGRPVLETLRAMDGREAKKFCKNRHPTATSITLKGKVQ